MRFGLSDLDELPSLKEFEALAREALGSDEGVAPSDAGDESVLDALPENAGEASAVETAPESAVNAEAADITAAHAEGSAHGDSSATENALGGTRDAAAIQPQSTDGTIYEGSDEESAESPQAHKTAAGGE